LLIKSHLFRYYLGDFGIMVKWLRNSKVAMWILTVARIWLGVQWALDGFGKLTSGFTASGLIRKAIVSPVASAHAAPSFATETAKNMSLIPGTGSLEHISYAASNQSYPWYADFLKLMTSNGTNTHLFDFLVSWGELLVGLGLIFGTLTLAASFFAMLMNFSFVLAGTVSVNPTYIILEFFFLVAGYNAGKVGLDRWVTPFLRSKIPFLNNDIDVSR
jgi:thiosulfate dehydrogenase [quinone] large subunit